MSWENITCVKKLIIELPSNWMRFDTWELQACLRNVSCVSCYHLEWNNLDVWENSCSYQGNHIERKEWCKDVGLAE